MGEIQRDGGEDDDEDGRSMKHQSCEWLEK